MRLRQRFSTTDHALLALRGVCHELRPSMAALSALVRALEQQPSEERRSELAGLAAEHAAHAQQVLREAAAVAACLADSAGSGAEGAGGEGFDRGVAPDVAVLSDLATGSDAVPVVGLPGLMGPSGGAAVPGLLDPSGGAAMPGLMGPSGGAAVPGLIARSHGAAVPGLIARPGDAAISSLTAAPGDAAVPGSVVSLGDVAVPAPGVRLGEDAVSGSQVASSVAGVPSLAAAPGAAVMSGMVAAASAARSAIAFPDLAAIEDADAGPPVVGEPGPEASGAEPSADVAGAEPGRGVASISVNPTNRLVVADLPDASDLRAAPRSSSLTLMQSTLTSHESARVTSTLTTQSTPADPVMLIAASMWTNSTPRINMSMLTATASSQRESTLMCASMLTPEPVQVMALHQLLPSVAATVSGERLHVSVGPGAARWPVHAQHTRQILINLVGNAARYTTGAIHLGARLKAWRLRLTVVDEGGPTPELLLAMRRAEPPDDDKGLGLWLVRHLAALHGGRVRARGVRTGGLIMEVLLPRCRP